MDREMRRQYTVLVDFLGHILGPDYEVALHELKDDSNEIIAIANGELTGRHLGSPLSNKMLEYLTSHLYETQDYVLRFESTAITGKKLCSNSLFIKGPTTSWRACCASTSTAAAIRSCRPGSWTCAAIC